MIQNEQTLVKTFNSIQDTQIQDAIIIFLSNIAILSKVESNKDAIELALNTKSLTDFVGHSNSPYLAKFVKFLVKTDDVETKDKVMQIVNQF
jgi:hypothetical protein